MRRRNKRSTAGSQNVSFELHTLGWEAFQNLCGHIAREVLGQTVTTFSPSGDAGQDGAFQGVWKKRKNEGFSGRFVLQCKFTARQNEHLSLSDLQDELTKAERLAKAGVIQTYLLISNAKITGESDLRIRSAFTSIPGIRYFDILGEEWITQSILRSKSLRAFVPRIYGLGDLSQILDERAYRQATEILQSWKDNLSKFVPTAAHERSVRALLDKGFVLLLGDPMAGKSTIAAALALAASDRWDCLPIFVHHPDDLKHWNPDEPHQFFWVDDAFGQIQLEPHLTAAWNRVMPHLSAAIRKGARILFTSRTYIYRSALREIKESAFPLLRDSQVVIHVEDLTLLEKERILYNHLRLGGQSQEFRTSLKPHLPAIAANPKFFPEVAKRLGNPFFTKRLPITADGLKRFVEEPLAFLYEIVGQLDKANFAALALLFMRGGRLKSPPRLDSSETEALALLGATIAQLCDAFRVLEGSLVSQVIEDSQHSWKFRHPTVRDAMALHVADRPELLDIYLGGVRVSELLTEVVCGGIEVAGAKVHVPESRFDSVVAKVATFEVIGWNARYSLLGFLGSKCSDAFLKRWVEHGKEQLNKLYQQFTVGNHSFSLLLSRLHSLRKLPETFRRRYVSDVERNAIQSAEATFLHEDIKNLLTEAEFAKVVARLRQEVVPSIEDLVINRETEYDDPEYDPSDHFDNLRSNFEILKEHFFEDDQAVWGFEEGCTEIKRAIERLEESNKETRERKAKEEREEEEERERIEKEVAKRVRKERKRESVAREETRKTVQSPTDSLPPRSIFDDVDA